MKRVLSSTLVLAVLLLCGPSPAESRSAASPTAVFQSPTGDRDLVLVATGERVEVLSSGSAESTFRLRDGERIEGLHETSAGFVAAGVRVLDTESEVIVVEEASATARKLRPPRQEDHLQLRPVLFVQDGDFIGAAWLEGRDLQSLRVKAADWNGEEWGPVETVSRRSPGSQTGLTGTVLQDGSLLLVWSQFDGNDDELRHSWRKSSGWSSPRPVLADNAQPDISPAVTFTRSGALLAWSRFDGSGYRLETATFERGRWSHQGTAYEGSLGPSHLHRDGEILTLFRSAWPRGWSLRKSDEQGNRKSETFVGEADGNRPIVADADRTSVVLAWPASGRAIRGRLEISP